MEQDRAGESQPHTGMKENNHFILFFFFYFPFPFLFFSNYLSSANGKGILDSNEGQFFHRDEVEIL